MAKRRAHDGRSTGASLFRNGSSIERLRYLVSHSNLSMLKSGRDGAARSAPRLCSHTHLPSDRPRLRGGVFSRFHRAVVCQRAVLDGQQQPQHALFEGENDCRGQAPHFPQPRQCRTPRSRTIARTCPEWVGSRLVAGEAVLRLFVVLHGAPLRSELQPASTCSALVFESSRRHGARTPPGSVMARCVHHASARWGAGPSRTRSIPAHRGRGSSRLLCEC